MSEAAALQTQTTKAPSSNSHLLLVQRKCACGGSSGLTGSCSDCEKKKLLGKPLQTKLRINEPGDEYEQDADRVAEQVMRMVDPTTETRTGNTPTAPFVQRRVSANAAGSGTAPPIVHDVLSSPGQPLDAATRAFFEPRFGHDFSHVRVHADAKAVESANSVNALAYTVGDHVVFNSGQDAPETIDGRRILAHELTHVIQQSNDIQSPRGRDFSGLHLQRQSPAAAPIGCTLEVCWVPIRAYHLGTAGQVHGVINVDSGSGAHHLEVDPSHHQARGSWHSHVVDAPGRKGSAGCQALTVTCGQVANIVAAASEFESRDVIYDPLTVTGPNSNAFVEWTLDRSGISTSLVSVPVGATGWSYFQRNPPQRTDPPHVARTDPGRTTAPPPRSATGVACAPAYTQQRTAAGYLTLVRAATTKLAAAGISNISDQIKILRGLYYGTPWSRDFGKEQSLSRVAGFQLFTVSGVEYPRDPVSILDCGLYDALQRSQDITVHGVTVDVGHLLIGLDARNATVAGQQTPNFPFPGFGGSGLDIVTWLGDLGGGAASLARDRVLRAATQSVSTKFSGVDYGGASNLEGDVAAYLVGRGSAASVVAPVVPPGSGLADILDTYLSPSTSGGSADWRSRATTFLTMFGGMFSPTGALSNEPALISSFADQIESFACAYISQRYVGTLSETQLLATCDHVRSCSHEVAETFVHALVDATSTGRIAAARFPAPSGPTAGACLRVTAPIRARRAAEQAARRAQELWEQAREAWQAL